MNKFSLKKDSQNDHLIEEVIKDPLYKITKDGKIFCRLTLNGQGVTDKWRSCEYEKDDGYHRMRYKDEFLFVQRVVYRKFKGPLDPKKTIDHLDKNRSNNNPDNLVQKTQGENNKNKSKKYKKAELVKKVIAKILGR